MKVKFLQNTAFYSGDTRIKALRGDVKEVDEKIGATLLTCKHAEEVAVKAPKKKKED